MRIKVVVLAFVFVSFTHHIIKISNTTVTSVDGRVHFHIKIFADDLTDYINSKQKTKSNFNKSTLTTVDKKVIENYIKANFVFYKNGVLEPLIFYNAKTDLVNPDNSVIDVMFKSKNLMQFKKGDVVKVKDTILFQNIPEQTNMVTLLNLIDSEIEVLTFSNTDKQMIQELRY